MALNFNTSPYFDDFDPTDNYHRILFKPGRAIQARELTQSQTILQNQISQFASAIYTQNTPISGGKITTNLNCDYLKLNRVYDGTEINISELVGQIVTNGTGIISAVIIAVSSDSSDSGDLPTLILSYHSGQKFSDNTTIYKQNSAFATTYNVSSSGKASVVSISSGVFFIVNGYNKAKNNLRYTIGNFVNVLPQTIILDKYSNKPFARVGLDINEHIINSSSDSTLLDPALGASNYQAPGADRYQITLSLITKPFQIGNDDGFIELLRVESGIIIKQVDHTIYSTIDDYFAKRDFESNGNYIVNDFKLSAKTNVDNEAKYDLNIGNGVAYVQGYRIENQSNLRLTSDRARTQKEIIADNTFIDFGNYFSVDTVNGSFDFTKMPLVDLHCVKAADIPAAANTNVYKSTLIGTAYIRNMDYQTGGSTPDSYIFSSFVSDINTFTLSANATNSSTITTINVNMASGGGTDGKFSNVTDAYVGCVVQMTSGPTRGEKKVITGYNATLHIITVDSPFNISPDITTQFKIIFSTGATESIVRRASHTSTTDYSLSARSNINDAIGKEKSLTTGAAILHKAGNPEMIYNLGSPYVSEVTGAKYYSTQIFRNSSFNNSGELTISTASPIKLQGNNGSTYYGDSFNQLFTVIDKTTGNILAFNTTSNTATITTENQVKFTATDYAGKEVIISAAVFISDASHSNILKIKELTVGNTTYSQALTNPNTVTNRKFSLSPVGDRPTGQVLIAKSDINLTKISLHVTDVKKITKIINVGTTGLTGPNLAAALTDYTDITNNFSFDDGQEDSHYGHSYIKLLPGVAIPSGDILVVFDYYSHTGGDGYFTVGSYLHTTTVGSEVSIATIPSYTSSSGKVYKLSDCVDFRPSFKNADSIGNWEFNAGVSSQGALIPQNLSNFQTNYKYYYGRKDKLVLTKDGDFKIIEGTPSNMPMAPTEPSGSMILANLTLDPFTAYVSGEGPSSVGGVAQNTVPPNLNIAKVLHKRWAKSDITDLQHQVDNLEYYTSLSLLEHKANSMQIPDVNGLNRFKNGILVDSFVDFGTADTASTDFECNINIREQKLSPLQDVNNFKLQNSIALKSYGTTSSTSTFHMSSTPTSKFWTLPYNKQILIKQTLASNTISVNPFNVTLYEGKAYLNPPMDNWINTHQPADIHITHPNFQYSQTPGGANIINGADWKALVGTESKQATPEGYTTEYGITKNTAVTAHIQNQEVIVRANGMLENTPVQCWFDGVNVDNYMTQPNTIELTSVVGIFKDDDVIGFFDNNLGVFHPIARVIGVTQKSSSNVLLSVANVINPPATVATTSLINAVFDTDGKFIKSTASGILTVGVQALHNTGAVKAVGGTWTTLTNNTPSNIFKSALINGATTFLNTYGVWGDQNNSASYSATFNFTVTEAGTYKLTGSHNGSVGTVSIDGVVKISGLNTTDKIVDLTLTAGAHTVSWVTTRAPNPATGSVAVTIGNNVIGLIWDSNDPNDLLYADLAMVRSNLPGGGTYYSTVKKISLDAQAFGATDSTYVGAKITFNTEYVYNYKYGAIYVPPKPTPPAGQAPAAIAGVGGDGDKAKQKSYAAKLAAYNIALASWNAQLNTYKASLNLYNIANNESDRSKNSITHLSVVKKFTSTITSYDHLTRTVTVDNPVNISIGFNSLLGKDITSTYSMSGIQLSTADAFKDGKSISQLSTSSTGKFVGLFDIPGSVFNTGQKIFRIDNRIKTGVSDPSSATTFAEAKFLAGHTYNVENFGSAGFDSSSKAFNKFNIVNTGNSSTYDPIAQTFIVDGKSYPNGVFIKSVKLFFASKDDTKDVSISIVSTVNGFPSGNILDNSTVSKHPIEVKYSDKPHYLDPLTYTEFEFSAPIYIKQDTLYAILIHSASSKYNIWLAKQNQLAIPSTTSILPAGTIVGTPKIGATPYCGALFESQYGLSWSADLSSDLMFSIDHCIFDITQKPILDFSLPKGLPSGKLGTLDILYGMDRELSKTVQSNFSNTQALDALNITTTDFIPSPCKIKYEYSSTLMSDKSVTEPVSITPGRYGCPSSDEVHLDDGKGQRVLLENIDNSFQLFATLSSDDRNVSPMISDDGVSMFDITYFINNLGISSDKISILSGGTGYNVSTTSITVSSPDVGSDTATLGFSVNPTTKEIVNVFVTSTGSGYTKTPTITITDALTRAGNTNANVVVVGETSPKAGNGFAKYVTKSVTLTPNNISGDLRVYYTAYKPLGTEIYTYYKISNVNDTDKFEDQNWQLMTQTSNSNVFSSDRKNLIEYEWAPGIGNNADNNISYTSTNGATYNNFITFAIKLVMTTNDNTKVPFIKDIRALALPSGTGI